MAELADALDSGSSESNFMKVQVLLPAPDKAENGSFSALLFAFRKKIVFMPHHGLKPTIFSILSNQYLTYVLIYDRISA